MKIGILCAGDSEVRPFLSMLEHPTVSERAMLRFHHGTLAGVPAVVLFSGVCKVNAAIAAQILIDACQCDSMISAGTAGGIDPRLTVFDTVVSTETAYHDVGPDILTDFHPWLPSVWFPCGPGLLALARQAAERLEAERRVFFGRMVTGEYFVEGEARERLAAAWAPLSADMESAAAAHVCYVNRTPFLSVRTITDTRDQDGTASFEENCARAARLSAEFVREMLRLL